MKGPINMGNHQDPKPQQELPQWLQVKLSVMEQAHKIFMAMSTNHEFATWGHDAIVNRAFLLATTFDKTAEEYLKPPAIHTPPQGFKV